MTDVTEISVPLELSERREPDESVAEPLVSLALPEKHVHFEALTPPRSPSPSTETLPPTDSTMTQQTPPQTSPSTDPIIFQRTPSIPIPDVTPGYRETWSLFLRDKPDDSLTTFPEPNPLVENPRANPSQEDFDLPPLVSLPLEVIQSISEERQTRLLQDLSIIIQQLELPLPIKQIAKEDPLIINIKQRLERIDILFGLLYRCPVDVADLGVIICQTLEYEMDILTRSANEPAGRPSGDLERQGVWTEIVRNAIELRRTIPILTANDRASTLTRSSIKRVISIVQTLLKTETDPTLASTYWAYIGLDRQGYFAAARTGALKCLEYIGRLLDNMVKCTNVGQLHYGLRKGWEQLRTECNIMATNGNGQTMIPAALWGDVSRLIEDLGTRLPN